MASFQLNNTKITIVQDDITKQQTDAIVNAANSHLKHGGGVAGAILRAGGEEIQIESDEWVKKHGPVPTSGVAVTGAGKLKAKYVIHTVGPVWGEGNEHEKLYRAVKNVLLKAQELGLKTISIPAISSGIFGFPKDECARVFLRAIKDFLNQNPKTSLEEICLCNIDRETSEIFLKIFKENWG